MPPFPAPCAVSWMKKIPELLWNVEPDIKHRVMTLYARTLAAQTAEVLVLNL